MNPNHLLLSASLQKGQLLSGCITKPQDRKVWVFLGQLRVCWAVEVLKTTTRFRHTTADRYERWSLL